MNRILSEQEKSELLDLNRDRINRMRRLPWSKQQKAFDRFTWDLNMCLTVNKDLTVDLSILAFNYIDNTDRKFEK